MDETHPLGGDTPDQVPAEKVARRAIRLLTEWSTDDPQLAETLRQIAVLPIYEPERHEAEAFLHMTQARAAWREADRLRNAERYRRAPRVAGPDDGRRQVTHGACTECSAKVRLKLDGTLRAHDPGSGAARSRSYAGPGYQRCEGSGVAPKA